MRTRREIFRCDRCGHETFALIESGLYCTRLPDGWVSVHIQPVGGLGRTDLYCSRACASLAVVEPQ